MRLLLSLFLIALFSINAVAQEQFIAQLNKNKVSTGEQFQISFSINANAGDFKPPAFNDFRVASGPNHEQSTSIDYNSGTYVHSLKISYLLVPIKEGNFTFKPASINVKGKRIESNEVSIQVTKGAPSQQGNQSPATNNSSKQQSQSASPPSDEIKDNFFVKISVDKNTAYLGEQITATYKIYYRGNASLSENKLPVMNGFWSQEVENYTGKTYTENVDGAVFNVKELHKTFLFPQRSGLVEIEPWTMEIVVQKRKPVQTMQDYFFGGAIENIKYALKSNQVKINVLALPDAGKPASFSGAVGHFQVETKMNKKEVKANEAISLNIAISGKGNLKLIESPQLNFPSDLEVYDPKISEKIASPETGVSGSVNYEYLIIPRHSGKYVLEPFNFSYFNPQTKSYHIINGESSNLLVEKGLEEENVIHSSANKEEVKQIGTDIQYIKTDLQNLSEKNKMFFGSLLFYILLFIPIIGVIVFVYFWNKYEKKAGNARWLTSRRATKVAAKRLKLAKQYLLSHASEKFYEEIFKALYGYLSDKLSIPVSELNRENIKEIMENQGINNEIIVSLIEMLDKCEFARFAPLTTQSLDTVYSEAENIIKEIEGEIKSEKILV